MSRSNCSPKAPHTGIYRLDEDGAVSLRRWGNDWHGIVNESEAFYMRILAPGDYRFRGADLGALVTRGRLQTDDNRLEERCKQWITGVRARRHAPRSAGAAAGWPAGLQDDVTARTGGNRERSAASSGVRSASDEGRRRLRRVAERTRRQP